MYYVLHKLFKISPPPQPRALFKGMLSPMLGMAVVNSIVFGVHAKVMQRLQPEGGVPDVVKSFVSGAVSGSTVVLICCPMELIKLRMQAQKDPVPLLGRATKNSSARLYSDPWDCVRKLYTEGRQQHGLFGGIRSLNQGFVVSLYREIPGYGLYFAGYDYLCTLLLRLRHGCNSSLDQLSPLELCMAGGVAGTVSWISVYPFDVVKSRMQVDGMQGRRQYRGMVHCFRESYRGELRELEREYREDVGRKPRPTKWRATRVFVKGMNSTVIRAFPVNAVTFGAYTLMLRFWRDRNDPSYD